MPKDIVWEKFVSGVTKFFSRLKGKKGLYLQGPEGIMFEEDAPDKKFNIHDGNCNFIVMESDFKKISKVPGVEAVTQLTPYKIRVAVAKLFNEKIVLDKINKAIDPFNGVHNEIVSEYINLAKGKYSDFVLYEDMYKMIHITNESGKLAICDGFLIFDSQTKPTGV